MKSRTETIERGRAIAAIMPLVEEKCEEIRAQLVEQWMHTGLQQTGLREAIYVQQAVVRLLLEQFRKDIDAGLFAENELKQRGD